MKNEKMYRYLVIKENGKKGISIKFSRIRQFKNLKKGNVVKLTESEAKMFPTYFELIDEERKSEIKQHIGEVLEKMQQEKNNVVSEVKKEEEKEVIIEDNDEEEDVDYEEVIVYDEDELNQMTVAQLRDLLNKEGIDTSGKKNDLITKYLAYVDELE